MGKLIADIGATNARFAMVDDKKTVRDIHVLPCNDFETITDAARAYLSIVRGKPPTTGAFAIATPLDGTDRVGMTNHAWNFSIRQTEKALGLKQLKILNDFTALALSVTTLEPGDYYKIGNGEKAYKMPIGIIGPGTGLGVAAVVFGADGKPVPVTTEGGHVTMAASNVREFSIFETLKLQKYSHVSAERVISGKGIGNIYDALCLLDKVTNENLSPAEITQKGLDNSCKTCAETLDLFCHFLGVAAGNLALSLGAAGGIFIAGGIVPQLGDYFKTSRFRDSFLAKGRFKEYLERIPTYVITHPYPGLEGLKNV